MGSLDQNNIEIGQRWEHPQKGYATIAALDKSPYTTVQVCYDDPQYEDQGWSLGDFYIKFRGPDNYHSFMENVKKSRRNRKPFEKENDIAK